MPGKNLLEMNSPLAVSVENFRHHLNLNAVIKHRAPEEETRRYVETAEHFWVIVKKESNSFSALVLWCSVFDPSRFLAQPKEPLCLALSKYFSPLFSAFP